MMRVVLSIAIVISSGSLLCTKGVQGFVNGRGNCRHQGLSTKEGNNLSSTKEGNNLSSTTAIGAATGVAEQQGLSTKEGNNLSSTASEFPPPQSQLDRVKRAAKFWSAALPVVLKYYGLIGRLLLRGNSMTEEEVEVREMDEKWVWGYSFREIVRVRS